MTKINHKNMSHDCILNFGQWEMFSEQYQPIAAFVYKVTQKKYRWRHFVKFIRTQEKYPTSLDKIIILTWILVISGRNFSWEINSSRIYSLRSISYLSMWLDNMISLLVEGLVHLVRTQNFPKIYHFLPSDTHTYMCVLGVKKY